MYLPSFDDFTFLVWVGVTTSIPRSTSATELDLLDRGVTGREGVGELAFRDRTGTSRYPLVGVVAMSPDLLRGVGWEREVPRALVSARLAGEESRADGEADDLLLRDVGDPRIELRKLRLSEFR